MRDGVAPSMGTWTDMDPYSVQSLPLRATVQNCSLISASVLTVDVGKEESSYLQFRCRFNVSDRSFHRGTIPHRPESKRAFV